MSSNNVLRAGLVVVALLGALKAAEASGRRHHNVTRPPVDVDAVAPRPHQFYPEEVENGVRGNLPFNNQMRKFSDPLNANGGGGA